MKNVLQYYYNLTPTTIHQINNDYRCEINNIEYLFRRIEMNTEEMSVIVELNNYLLSIGMLCHQIIKNINDDVVTFVDGNSYVLLRLFTNHRQICEYDLIVFGNSVVEKSKYIALDRSNWYDLWVNKVDYIEYQASQLGKNYPLIRQSINYYIGQAETAISLISNIKNNSLYLSIAHKRIKNKGKFRDLYDPLQFILDTRIRDLSEYYKERFFSDEVNLNYVNEILSTYKLNSVEALLFFSRMIFPTYYFDCFQEIVLGDVGEKELKRYICKVNEYQIFLRYLYFNLRQFYELPEIEWIIKT